MTDDPSKFTLADVLRRKAEGRKDAVRLTFGEKLAIIERMRDDLAPLVSRREKLAKDKSGTG